MNYTHIGRESLPEDANGRFVSGPILAVVDGNRVALTRLNRRGLPVVISDEVIPDEYLSAVLEGLAPIDSDEGRQILRNTSRMN